MEDRRSDDGRPTAGGGSERPAAGQRKGGVIVDLERLESHAESLYLHRFVEAVRRARGEHGRYLVLRHGDELAIAAAGDGSAEYLEDASVEETPAEDGPGR
ncbi:MAG TPA: hypothetical protein VHN37_07160 [Actinomycetota bacterium]|nr:hypothetical protein [Actinomycetota bacterium]